MFVEPIFEDYPHFFDVVSVGTVPWPLLRSEVWQVVSAPPRGCGGAIRLGPVVNEDGFRTFSHHPPLENGAVAGRSVDGCEAGFFQDVLHIILDAYLCLGRDAVQLTE